MSEQVTKCADIACGECPWRKSNKGKPSPKCEGATYRWYSATNQRRLWSAIRQGERMTCHPTDHANPPTLDGRRAPETIQTRECAGALILVQREITLAQELRDPLFKRYRRNRPHGLSLTGLRKHIERIIFGGRWPGMKPVGRPDLNDTDVQYEPLGEWRAR